MGAEDPESHHYIEPTLPIPRHQGLYDLLSYARLAPTTPSLPSRKAIRERLRDFVTESQQETLQRLPSNAKMSIALDCWTSPSKHAFMAITGYILDQDWEYREVLLGLNQFLVLIPALTLAMLLFRSYNSTRSLTVY